jgi:hypothetical protein
MNSRGDTTQQISNTVKYGGLNHNEHERIDGTILSGQKEKTTPCIEKEKHSCQRHCSSFSASNYYYP